MGKGDNVMDKQEELMLLGALLYDVRLNWADEIVSRLKEAKKLAANNKLKDIEEKIDEVLEKEYEYQKNPYKTSYFDGRVFRGYYEDLLGDQQLAGKSIEFQAVVRDLCTCGDGIFEDWD